MFDGTNHMKPFQLDIPQFYYSEFPGDLQAALSPECVIFQLYNGILVLLCERRVRRVLSLKKYIIKNTVTMRMVAKLF